MLNANLAYAISKKYILQRTKRTVKTNPWNQPVITELQIFSTQGETFVTACLRSSKIDPVVSYFEQLEIGEKRIEYKPAWQFPNSLYVFCSATRQFQKVEGTEYKKQTIITRVSVPYISDCDMPDIGYPCVINKTTKTRKLSGKWAKILKPLTPSPAERSDQKTAKKG